jgi:hypothetical protein
MGSPISIPKVPTHWCWYELPYLFKVSRLCPSCSIKVMRMYLLVRFMDFIFALPLLFLNCRIFRRVDWSRKCLFILFWFREISRVIYLLIYLSVLWSKLVMTIRSLLHTSNGHDQLWSELVILKQKKIDMKIGNAKFLRALW